MSAILEKKPPFSTAEIVTPEIARRIAAPIDSATSLPNDAYTNPGWFDAEKNRIFARSWVVAGFGSQIPEPGCRLVTEVAGQSIVLVRNNEGVVRGFCNVCRHRGVTLCDGSRNKAPRLTCPYHSWTYDLDGNLVARPNFYGAGVHDRREAGDRKQPIALFPVRVKMFHDFIMVNVDGMAPAVEEYLRPIAELIEGYDLSDLALGKTMHYDIGANWKLVTENFIDASHKPTIHPALEQSAPLTTNEPAIARDNFIAHIHTVTHPSDARGANLPYIKTTPEKRMWGLGVHVFPSLNFVIWPDQMVVVHLTPKSTTQTLEQIHVFFAKDAMNEEHTLAREKVYEAMHALNLEDMRPMEGMQQGRVCNQYDGGIYCPYWDTPIHHFSRLVLDAMSSSSGES